MAAPGPVRSSAECTTCGREYPRTTEFFAPRPAPPSRSGFTSRCRPCQREIARNRQASRRADPEERKKLLEEKRRYAHSVKGRMAKRRESETSNHRRRQRLLEVKWDWSLGNWEEAKRQWDHACAYCGKNAPQLHQDHFVPLAHAECSGTHVGNMVPACPTCNLRKGHLHPKDFLPPEIYLRVVAWLSRREAVLLAEYKSE